MLKRIRDLDGWTVKAADATNAGTIRDFLFDDERWTIRYLVVETGTWLMGRRVLISSMSVERTDWDLGAIQLTLDRDRVEGAPPVDWNRPIDRRYESGYATYYGYPLYWTGPGLWAEAAYPFTPAAPHTRAARAAESATAQEVNERHLRSVHEVSGYHISATDGEIGHVEDFLVEDADWRIRYLLVDTSNWIGGRTVLLDPEWVERVEWGDRLVHVDVTRDAVKSSPDYHPGMDIDAAYETRLRDAYGRSLTDTTRQGPAGRSRAR